jgi:hypothetical protein
VSRVRAGHERDTYEQGNETSTAHRNIGHSITSARVAGSAKVETEPEKVRFRPGICNGGTTAEVVRSRRFTERLELRIGREQHGGRNKHTQYAHDLLPWQQIRERIIVRSGGKRRRVFPAAAICRPRLHARVRDRLRWPIGA